MKKSKWLDCQGNEFFPKQKGTPSLVKIEHKNTATLDSARSKKNLKSQFCNYLPPSVVSWRYKLRTLSSIYLSLHNHKFFRVLLGCMGSLKGYEQDVSHTRRFPLLVSPLFSTLVVLSQYPSHFAPQ